MKSLRSVLKSPTARILLIAAAALALLLACWLVFGKPQATTTSAMTDDEARLAAVLSEVEDAGDVSVFVTREGDTATGAVVFFSGKDGILVRLRLTQIAARVLDIAENRVLVCPSGS